MDSAPSFKGLKPASPSASRAARGASRKTDTRCELKLRRALWKAGARYRKNVSSLPGTPDIVFQGPRLVVFCDGDYWHGKDWEERRKKLARGTNSQYWLAKIQRNIERDEANNQRLKAAGWTVLRYWESDIHADVTRVATDILERLQDLDTTSSGAVKRRK